MSEEFWNLENQIRDYLFDTNMSIAQIAPNLGMSQSELRREIKRLGLDWVVRKNRKLSRGHACLTEMMQALLPGEKIINEHHIGDRLMLDIYCPSYQLAAEYHGRQHFYYSTLFHKDRQDFLDQQKRDEAKIERCKELGIALLSFRYNDDMTYDIVFNRMIEAIKSVEKKEPEKASHTLKDNPFYEKVKQSQRENRKKQYQRFKEWKKTHG